MPELKEVFDIVAEQSEPDVDAWTRLERHRWRSVLGRRVGTVFLAAAVVAVAFGLALRLAERDETTGITPPPKNEPTDTRLDLYVFDPKSSGIDDVLLANGDQSDPEMSPDGTRIVYESTVDGVCCQIFLHEADGTVHQLTALEPGAENPTWSPDGTRIAFTSGTAENTVNPDIFVINADGTGLRRLGGTSSFDGAPDWSPNGETIVFQGGVEDSGSIWTISVRTGELTRLTNPRVGDRSPGWSADGKWIVFVRLDGMGSQLEFVDSDIWVMRADGSDQRRLVRGERHDPYVGASSDAYAPATPDGHFQKAPIWSPDGRLVAFAEIHCDCITTIDVATGRTTSIDGSIGLRLDDLSWNPDGTILVCRAEEDSSYNVVE